MSVNISLIVLKKMYDILMIFVDFCWNFPDPIPDPADQNETDPNGSGSGSETLLLGMYFGMFFGLHHSTCAEFCTVSTLRWTLNELLLPVSLVVVVQAVPRGNRSKNKTLQKKSTTNIVCFYIYILH